MAGLSVSAIDRRIAERVRAARKAIGHTQATAATALGVSTAQFQKYEGGHNRISAGMLQTLADLFGVPVAHFFDAPADAPAIEEAA